MSEYSNAPEVMREFIRAQTNKQGKKVIPRYLKDDFPDNTLIPCKQLIANLPSHIDRPPAEKFDELVIKVFKGMRKPPKKVSKKQKKTSQSQDTQGGTAALKNRQSELEIKNMHEQLASDQQYKAMFGGDELIIKRHYRIKQPQQPIINAEDESELNELQVIVSPPRLNIESQIEFSKAEFLSRQIRSMSSGGLGVAMSSQKQQETATILSEERQEVPNSLMSGSKNLLSNVTLNIPKEQVASFQTNQTNKSKSNKYKVELDNQELIVKMPLGTDGQKVKPPQFYSKFSKYAQNEKKPPSFIPIPEDFFSKAIQKPKSKSISGGVISMADLSRPLTTMHEANQRIGFGRSRKHKVKQAC
ncbi:hypothetical protein FGO68_gene11245 [Halteria grandinella]|uniref:Uncharacterized protein n=1 Tax=Halteria grandinella TaxID=5974 RepID=A0A8J8NZS3_HALGN|nr:hypothetical protein FGO68_gene11245 [Halteria grandinella]